MFDRIGDIEAIRNLTDNNAVELMHIELLLAMAAAIGAGVTDFRAREHIDRLPLEAQILAPSLVHRLQVERHRFWSR
jgi:hypothetical protein